MNNNNELLYMAADNLQLTLNVVDGRVHGSGVKDVTLILENEINIGYTVTVVDSFTSANKEEVQLAVHVLGDLYLILHCSLITNVSTILLLDGNVLKLKTRNKILPLHTSIKNTINYFDIGIVGVFAKSNDNEWIERC